MKDGRQNWFYRFKVGTLMLIVRRGGDSEGERYPVPNKGKEMEQKWKSFPNFF